VFTGLTFDQYLPLITVGGIGIVMYFITVRPQKKQQQERTAMISAIKKGDRVITLGGIYGIVRAIKDERITLEIATEIYVQFTKQAIGTVVRNDTKAEREPDVITQEDVLDAEDADYEIEQDADEDNE